MITILEFLWATDKQVILRLIGLGFLTGILVETVIGEQLPKATGADIELREYERLMRHSAYRRGRGGALRQVRYP